MPGARAQGRLLHDAVDVAELEVVLRRDLEVLGAVLNEFRGGALSGFKTSFNGGGPFGRNDRIVAVRKHEPFVGKADGLGAA